MKDCYGQFGWREFNRNRKSILDEFDKVLEQTINRPVRTAHGVAGEAFIRKWLEEFLPQKYGVTSGYVIPDLYDDCKLYHYDVIIYNKLESPVLWTESNFDQSDQGKYRAIPAKYVVSIFEVKAQFNERNVSESLEKLSEVDQYVDQLPINFSTGIIFIEMKSESLYKYNILRKFKDAYKIKGFLGAIILRNKEDESSTGLINIQSRPDGLNIDNEDESKKPLTRAIDELEITKTEDGKVHLSGIGVGAKLVCISKDVWGFSKLYNVNCLNGEYITSLNWSRSNFSEFCKNILSHLDNSRNLTSNKYSFGMVLDSIKEIKALEQNENDKTGQPFVRARLEKNIDSNTYITKLKDSSSYRINFILYLENQSSLDLLLLDVEKSQYFELPGYGIVSKLIEYDCLINEKNSEQISVEDFLNNGIAIRERIIYYPKDKENELYGFDINVKLFENSAELTQK